jgi:hypothetical protein
MAGIIGATRREKGNVIPGVAIATALMPPLCTAGYGIATGHLYYFLGAIYLFFINSVFICIATVLILRFMKFRRHVFADQARGRRVTGYIVLTVAVTVIPSIWLGYRIVQKAVFENAAEAYVRKEFNFINTQVVSKAFTFDTKPPRIELLLIGRVLDSLQIDTLEQRLSRHDLKGTRLVVRQGLDARQEIDFAQVKASILNEVFKYEDTAVVPAITPPPPVSPSDIAPELAALFPQVRSFSLNKVAVFATDSLGKIDSSMMLIADAESPIKQADQDRLQEWLQAKFAPDSVQIVIRLSK